MQCVSGAPTRRGVIRPSGRGIYGSKNFQGKHMNGLEIGKRYLFVLTHGWGMVGTVQAFVGLCEVTLSDAYFITRCGDNTDWGRFMRNSPGKNAIVNRLNNPTINLDHRIWSDEFSHELPETR